MKKIFKVVIVGLCSFLLGIALFFLVMKLVYLYDLKNLIAPTGNICNQNWCTRKDLAKKSAPALIRAYIAYFGLGANQIEETIYWTAMTDDQNNKLNGKHTYDIYFQEQPKTDVLGFWSITVYNQKGFMVPNSFKRYSLGDRSILFKQNDGSFHITVSSNMNDFSPNWLLSPIDENFSLSFRIYLPLQRDIDYPEHMLLPKIKCLDCN